MSRNRSKNRTQTSAPSLPGQSDRPAQPADNDTSIEECEEKPLVDEKPLIKESIILDPTQGRPTCEGCPSFISPNSCWLNPTPVEIADPKNYGCSYHPSFKEFVLIKARRKNDILNNPKGEYNCSCVMIGASHHDVASTNMIKTPEGRFLVARKGCQKCSGSGIDPAAN